MGLKEELQAAANPTKAKVLQGFFRTGKGEYGEGDIFLGLTVPQTRAIAKRFTHLGLPEIKKSLESGFHEERLCALLVLVHKFGKADEAEKEKIFDFYLANARRVNNWDMVDLTADKIVGEHLLANPSKKKILPLLAASENLWERRIAIISTFALIKKGKAEDTFKISQLLLRDSHDLIHKAVGWMLREVGKRVSEEEEEKFLAPRYKKMPRTMLRYAIERFQEKKRKAYLHGSI
ncbi:MAG: DNA alkylation repair protein [Candidatus Diapherotrites archaeon]|uniref:DNA alkylation repair protein n=1 Tax=Candidatus Iainarchaeum sp. TaxID=3101447 RepID=A0A8T3YQG1_9ARCH|nr:DNA alkylation repair protein [Candidatus Diapherotrites archaeon]